MNFSNPKKNIRHLGLKPGMHVADLGCGSGHYTFLCAEEVGDSGKVYALDIQDDLLLNVSNEAKKRGLHNVEIIWADLEKEHGSKLADESMDVLIVVNIFFQIVHKDVFLKEAARILKTGGRIFFKDWSDSFGGIGPQKGDLVSKDETVEMFSKVGFIAEKSDLEVGAHHYGLIFKEQ